MKLLGNTYLVNGWGYLSEGCNIYIVETDSGLVMIDCGYEEELDATFEHMEDWELDPQNVTHVLLTHEHGDHSSAAWEMKERGAILVAHARAGEGIEAGDERTGSYRTHRAYIPCQIDMQLGDQELLEFGDLLIEAIHMPGHTEGCVIYRFTADGKQVTLTDDVVQDGLDGTIPGIGWEGSVDLDSQAYIKTLRRLYRMGTDVLLPGHRSVALKNGTKWIGGALAQAQVHWHK